MKKILILFCLALTCQAAISQMDPETEKKKKMEEMFGISLGLNYAKIVGEHEDNDPLWRGHAGLYMGLWRKDRWLLNTLLLYSMMGTKFSDDANYSLSYLVLPIMINYMIIQQLYFGLGVQPGLLLSAKYKLNDQSTDIKDNLNSFDFGIPFMLRYQMMRNFALALMITPGMSNIFKTGNNSAKNFVGSLQFTYNF